MKEIQVAGFTSSYDVNDRPAISVFGLEGTGKTRLGATMPTPIGFLPLDKKCKRTVKDIQTEMGLGPHDIWMPQTDIANDSDLLKLANMDDATEKEEQEATKASKRTYAVNVNKVYEALYALATSQVESICIDNASILHQWILYKHFGRTTKIMPLDRGKASAEIMELINMCRTKNLLVINRCKEIWKKTGAKDKQGNDLREPSGEFEVEGFKGIGYAVLANIELINRKTVKVKEDGEGLERKFLLKIHTCQTNSFLEGRVMEEESGLVGQGITWDMLMAAIGYTG